MRSTCILAALLAIAGCTTASAQVFVPDNNFEAHLEANGFSDGVPNNDFVANSVSTITILNISGLGIADLTGIASFTSLVELNCSNNLLTSVPFSSLSQNLEVLDFSNNSIGSVTIPVSNTRPIREFRAGGNLLTSLNASRLGASLQSLDCSNNNLTTLSLNNPGLEELRCENNALASLDLSASPLLSVLWANGNSLAALDLGNNPSLTSLRVQAQDVPLSSLTLPPGPALEELRVDSNNLGPTLDVSGKPVLTSFNAANNPTLLCIQVDDATAANAGAGQYAPWIKDAIATYFQAGDGGSCPVVPVELMQFMVE